MSSFARAFVVLCFATCGTGCGGAAPTPETAAAPPATVPTAADLPEAPNPDTANPCAETQIDPQANPCAEETAPPPGI